MLIGPTAGRQPTSMYSIIGEKQTEHFTLAV